MQKTLVFAFLLAFAPLFAWSSVFGAQYCQTYCDNLSRGVQDTQPVGQTCICNPLQAKTFTDVINNILNFLFGVSIVIIPIMVVFAGFMFLTAGGNPAQFTKARGLLLWTAVGFGVILLAKGLTTVLRKIIGF